MADHDVKNLHAAVKSAFSELAVEDDAFSALAACTCKINETLSLISINPPLLNILEMSPENLAGKRLFDIIDNSREVLDFINLGTPEFAVPVTLKSRSRGPLQCVMFARQYPAGGTIANCLRAAFSMNPDQSGTAGALELEKVQEFLATMAHELRNPMTPILGHAQMMRRLVTQGEVISPRLLKSLERLELAVEVFSRRASVIMEVSRIASGQLKIKPEPHDLQRLATEAIERHQGLADALNIPLHFHASGAVAGRFDKIAVEQILDNLLSNAFKFSNEKPVEVRVLKDGAFATIEIEDGGVGIPSGRLSTIFDNFDQGENARRSGGFGIGLWVVSRLVRAMGGSITVDSVIDQGSLFQVKIPLEGKEWKDDQ